MRQKWTLSAGSSRIVFPLVATVAVLLSLQTLTSRTYNSSCAQRMLQASDWDAALLQAGTPAAGKPVPRIVHHMHQRFEALSLPQKLLVERCRELNPSWQFMFWDDNKMRAFIKSNFAWYFPTWDKIHPFIKKIDSSRYILMHHFGGIYLDVDVECVRPFDTLTQQLPLGAAWMGDFPEPMFLMSSPGNIMWLHVLTEIASRWDKLDAWHSTGPLGLNHAVTSWVQRHGSGVLVPYITGQSDEEFVQFIKDKNNTIPWFVLANGQLQLHESQQPRVWIAPGHAHNAAAERINFTEPQPPHMRVGFIANELLDAIGCDKSKISDCMDSLCKDKYPLAYTIHHCTNTWRGRIGTT